MEGYKRVIKRGETFQLGKTNVEFVGVWGDGVVFRYLDEGGRDDLLQILTDNELREYGLTWKQDENREFAGYLLED